MARNTKKQSGFQFTLLAADTVAAVQEVFAAQTVARESAHTVAVALYDKGYTPESLTVPTEKKPNPKFNKQLYLEIVNAVLLSPRFGDAGRKVIQRKLAGVKADSADEATMRRLEMGKINAVVSQIRAALKTAHETGGDTKKPKTLHEVLTDALVSGIATINNKGDKAGVNVPELLAAWRECHAKTNALFRAKQ